MNKFTFILFIAMVVIPACTTAQMRKGNILLGKVSSEQFGRNVKISADGNTLALGFPHSDENGNMSGKVVVYGLTNLIQTIDD